MRPAEQSIVQTRECQGRGSDRISDTWRPAHEDAWKEPPDNCLLGTRFGPDLDTWRLFYEQRKGECMKNDYSKLTPEAKEALVVKAKNCGYATETLYGNCAQSLLNGIYRAFPDLGLSEDIIKASYGLAGGTGCCLEGTCGAVSGAAMVISLLYGRPVDDLDGDYGKCHEIIRELESKFKEEYGSILCPDVLRHNMGDVYDWKTEEGDRQYMEHFGTHHCARAVQFCTEYVSRLIAEGASAVNHD